MSSQYYAYAVVGVRASLLMEFNNEQVEFPVKVRGEPVYDKDGNPKVEKHWVSSLIFQGTKYYFKKSVTPADLVVSDLEEVLEKIGLKWISYDYQSIYKHDVIGIVVDEYEKESTGVDLAKIAETLKAAKEKLTALGCSEEPKLFAAFYHSY